MKSFTDRYKETIKSMGRQIDTIITYTSNGQNHTLVGSQLISVTPYFNGNILKSVMKQLDFETTALIPKGTVVNVRFGILVNRALTVDEVDQMKVERMNDILVGLLVEELKEFEYMNFGNYIIKDEPTYNADTNTYTYNCFDKMLYSMIPYESMNLTYPITIRNYINAICNKLGLTFKNVSDTFANYDKQIQGELYLDSSGKSLDYTFRDVLDELAQVTASTICINETDDELEIRYISNTNDTINEEFLKDVNVEFKEKYRTN